MAADCDLLIVGGGLAGASLASTMAREGASVIVVERELAFRDRVRGEVLFPWGAAEARRLGLYDRLLERCGMELRHIVDHMNGQAAPGLDLAATPPYGWPSMAFLHPVMQEALVGQAEQEGATVWRGATVDAVVPGDIPEAVIAVDGGSRRVRARLVVGADGRDSRVAHLMRFDQQRDPEELLTAGMLVEGSAEGGTSVNFYLAHGGRAAILFSPAPGLVRVYLIHHRDALPRRLSGERDVPEAFGYLRQVGVPDAYLDGVRLRGPFATFDGAHRWIDRPYKDGVVLVGDAAAASDPAWGNGLSRTLRDVRLLRDALLADEHWARAAMSYAVDHDDFCARLREIERLYATLWMSIGPEADARRERALAVLEDEPEFNLSVWGPETHCDAILRARLFDA